MPHPNHLYSPEADAILGTIPSWIIRWGVTVVAVIFVGILVGCYFIKYPDTVQAPIAITTVNPPADLAARYAGLLDTVCIENGQQVHKGELLMLLKTAADYDDVASVETNLVQCSTEPCETTVSAAWLDGSYTLGDLQATYSQYQQKCMDYRHYLETNMVGRKKQLLAEQAAKNEEYYSRLQKQQRLLDKDMRYEAANVQRDSMLYAEAVISEADYQTSARNLIQKQNNKAGFDATMTSTELTIIQNRQQIVELTLQEENERATYERDLNQLRQQLLAQIAQWKEQYAIIAPADGKVSLLSYWTQNQRVNVGDVLASVVPEGTTEVVGRMQVPSASFGKVEVGQTVNVKLNGYPYMEFGVLKGTIRSISAVPETVQTTTGNSIAYVAEVAFAANLTTTYKKELPMIQQMDGTGEIITKDMRLIGRFFNPIRALFDK